MKLHEGVVSGTGRDISQYAKTELEQVKLHEGVVSGTGRLRGHQCRSLQWLRSLLLLLLLLAIFQADAAQYAECSPCTLAFRHLLSVCSASARFFFILTSYLPNLPFSSPNFI